MTTTEGVSSGGRRISPNTSRSHRTAMHPAALKSSLPERRTIPRPSNSASAPQPRARVLTRAPDGHKDCLTRFDEHGRRSHGRGEPWNPPVLADTSTLTPERLSETTALMTLARPRLKADEAAAARAPCGHAHRCALRTVGSQAPRGGLIVPARLPTAIPGASAASCDEWTSSCPNLESAAFIPSPEAARPECRDHAVAAAAVHADSR